MTNDNNLWVTILRDKYLRNHTIQSWPIGRNASHTWRSIMHIRHILEKGTKWTIGDGKSVDLWKDWWCGNGTLANRYPGPHTEEHIKVEAIIDNGTWNLSSIEHIVDEGTCNDILNIKLPSYSQVIDHPSWGDSVNGLCTASPAYDMIKDDRNDLEGWNWFWKMKVPQKFKSFIWLIFHNKLPTNSLRARRGMATSDSCPRCNGSPETINHLFRDCPKVIPLWDKFHMGRTMREGFESSTNDWISHNLKRSKIIRMTNEIPWNLLFCAILWQIWKDRNRKSFDNIDMFPEVSSKMVCSYAFEIVEAFKSPLVSGPTKNRLTLWCAPNAGNLKLNTDGCWYESNGKAGFRGIFRNARGDWELGFYGRMMASSSLETELWGIYRGLTIILEKGLYNVQLESDSQTAVILINEGANTTHPHNNIINDGKYLLERTKSKLTHIYRGANECADFLARLGAEQMEDLMVSNTPPLEIREFMNRDSQNLRQFLD